MLQAKTSAKLSLAVCIASAVLFVVLLFTFPVFIRWLYVSYHVLAQQNSVFTRVQSTVIPAFYACSPFAAASLFMLIRLLLHILHDEVFIRANVQYLRLVSWCCFAVVLVTLGFGIFYAPLLLVCCAAGIVGTLLRVVKNVMQAAVELREENDLTI